MTILNQKTSMIVPNRIHIIPLGYERDRVVEPPIELSADVVVLLAHSAPENTKPSYHTEVIEALEDASLEVKERSCDIFDLYACLGEVAETITKYREDEIYVNLATGSKVTAIAGMIACMATGATPYYVRAERYGPETDHPPTEPVSYGVAGIDELPAYPIEGPAPQHIAILAYLHQEGRASKKELIEFSEEADLPYLRTHESDNIKGKYRLLDSHILNSLQENEYVEVKEVGRKKYVSMTDNGINTLRAFNYLIN